MKKIAKWRIDSLPFLQYENSSILFRCKPMSLISDNLVQCRYYHSPSVHSM